MLTICVNWVAPDGSTCSIVMIGFMFRTHPHRKPHNKKSARETGELRQRARMLRNHLLDESIKVIRTAHIRATCDKGKGLDKNPPWC